MIKGLIHKPTGIVKSLGFYEPTLPVTGQNPDGSDIFDPDYFIVKFRGDRVPDTIGKRWDFVTGGLRDETAQEKIDRENAELDIVAAAALNTPTVQAIVEAVIEEMEVKGAILTSADIPKVNARARMKYKEKQRSR